LAFFQQYRSAAFPSLAGRLFQGESGISLERFKTGFFEQICKLQLFALSSLSPFPAFHRTDPNSGPGGIFLLRQGKLSDLLQRRIRFASRAAARAEAICSLVFNCFALSKASFDIRTVSTTLLWWTRVLTIFAQNSIQSNKSQPLYYLILIWPGPTSCPPFSR